MLSWLVGNPRRFKTYVGNQVSDIVDCIPPDHWKHVNGVENHADCGSRGLLPKELLEHELWWEGPKWLHEDPSHWPQQTDTLSSRVINTDEEKNVCLSSITHPMAPIIPLNRYSSFTKLKRISAWMFRFLRNCRFRINNSDESPNCLSYFTVKEISSAEQIRSNTG